MLVNDFGAIQLEVGLTAPDGIVQLVHGWTCCSSRSELQASICLMGGVKMPPEQILGFKGDMAQIARVQISSANLVVFNEIDLVSSMQLNRVLVWLQAFKADQSIFKLKHGCLPIEALQSKSILTNFESMKEVNNVNPKKSTRC